MKNIIHRHASKIMFATAVLFLVLVAGCTSEPQQAPAASLVATTGCTDKECFISEAKACKDSSLTLAEDVGVLRYSTSKDCVFTKTLVSLNANETQEMKTLLEGKSMACKYEEGEFDRRLVTSLIFGMEYCNGELKDALGQLIVFA